MSIIRAAFWIALFLASTFCFIVLFEYGPMNFAANSKKEFESLKTILGMADAKKKAPPTPLPAR